MSSSILIGGDLFPSDNNHQLFEMGDISELFGADIIELFRDADYSFCNLEGCLTEETSAVEKSSGPVIKSRPSSINGMKALGINCLNLANNHSTDFLDKGYADTEKIIQESGLCHVGGGKNSNCIKTNIQIIVGGRRICVYSVGETMYNAPTCERAGINLYDEYRVCKEIELLKACNDFLIVLYHGGIEYFQYPTVSMRTKFHRMADSGADIILAQHTHCIGCEEYYKDAYLLYGQGNFLFARQKREITKSGLLVKIVFNSSNRDFSIIKYKTLVKDGRVRLDTSQDLTDFYERSKHVDDFCFLDRQFQDFCKTQKEEILRPFYNYNIINRIFRRVLPTRLYDHYKRACVEPQFTSSQIQRLYYILISEQQWETTKCILEFMLHSNEVKI